MAYRAALVDEDDVVVSVIMVPADSGPDAAEFTPPDDTRLERVDYDSPLAPGWTWSDDGDDTPPEA